MRFTLLFFTILFSLFHLFGCARDKVTIGDADIDSNVPNDSSIDASQDTDAGMDATMDIDTGTDSGMDAAMDMDAEKDAADDHDDETDDAGADSGNDDLDKDGIPDDQDAFPDDPEEWADTDGDSIGNNADPDDDNDNVLDDDDTDDLNPTKCSDTDSDGCDDCSSGEYAIDNDGDDFDEDGTCDIGDEDDDNDGVLDDDDTDDFDPKICSDTDNDGCDDCSSGEFNIDSDGDDFDEDGLCDAGDIDDDDDGSLDDDDSDDDDPMVCSDIDADGCDDCNSGFFDPNNDGEDTDEDGLCDEGDAVSDDPTQCSDHDEDGCDDCSSGSYNRANDGDDFDSDGLCDAGDTDDDLDLIEDSEDNCLLMYNAAQIDQDEDGEGDACDDTPCPEDGCLSNCKAIFDTENVEVNGHYAIDIDGEGGRDPMVAFCIMNPENGGWTLVLNYTHLGGTNPELVVLDDELPRASLASYFFLFDLVIDESGTDRWGHADNALIADLNPTEVRFRGFTSAAHGRVIDFATTDQDCIDYVTTGNGNCQGVSSDFTPNSSHTGYLPDAADSGLTDQEDFALTELPFFQTDQYHWAIRAEGNRWEVDDISTEGPETSTLHQVWVR